MDIILARGQTSGWTQPEYAMAVREMLREVRSNLRAGNIPLNSHSRPWATPFSSQRKKNMTLYFWEEPHHYPNKLMAIYEDNRSINRVLFMYGQTVAPEQVTSRPILRFTASKQKLKEWDCLVNSSGIPIVNPRARSLLQELAPEDIQLFPVKVVCDDGVSLDDALVNIIHRVYGIDHEKSVYSRMKMAPDTISRFKRAVYKSGCMETHLLARDGDYLPHILVAPALREAFQREKVKGVRFVTPDEYYGGLFGY